MKLLSILAFVSILAVAMVLYYTFNSPLWISAEEAKRKIANGEFPVILDVRTDMEYKLGHYPEAVHIPTARLSQELEQKIPNKKVPVLVYCNTGQRARYAADVLKKKGYESVRYISGPHWSLLR